MISGRPHSSLLHSPDYRSRYADNLGKELPRIPAVKKFADFRAFSKAGRDLAHWHLNYETVEPYPGVEVPIVESTSFDFYEYGPYRVTKMKFAKKRDPETNKSINDKTTIIYNDYLTLRGIPLEAYDYVVNGKPAIEWVMERQAITTDKDSGIVNDANLWATETMNDPAYPLNILLRVITLSHPKPRNDEDRERAAETRNLTTRTLWNLNNTSKMLAPSRKTKIGLSEAFTPEESGGETCPLMSLLAPSTLDLSSGL